PSIKQPKGLKVKLKPHQLTSIAAMRELEKQGSIIIDKPSVNIDTNLYYAAKVAMEDTSKFHESTFILETNYAILADKVGSGKTYMALGLILSRQDPGSRDRLLYGKSNFSIKMLSNGEPRYSNLIVVPHNLANQWEDFTKKSKLTYLKLNKLSDFDI